LTARLAICWVVFIVLLLLIK